LECFCWSSPSRPPSKTTLTPTTSKAKSIWSTTSKTQVIHQTNATSSSSPRTQPTPLSSTKVSDSPPPNPWLSLTMEYSMLSPRHLPSPRTVNGFSLVPLTELSMSMKSSMAKSLTITVTRATSQLHKLHSVSHR